MTGPGTAATDDAGGRKRGRTRGRPRAPRADAVRTRAALLSSARRVFERDGYVHARIADIAAGAHVAHGSFYTHFDGKEDVFAAVLEEVAEEMLHPGPAFAGPAEDVAALIDAANRAYLLAYRRNARMMALLEQVATVDARFRRLRLRRTNAFVARNAALIRTLQEDGWADCSLDPELAAGALSAMVSRSAYLAFAAGRRVDFEQLAATLTRLWVNALQPVPATGSPRRRARSRASSGPSRRSSTR
jgi:AcrR family transcriptional regulator